MEDTEKFPDVDLMLFDKVIAFDHLRQKIILIVNMKLHDVESEYNKAVMELKQLARSVKKWGKEERNRRKASGKSYGGCLAKNSFAIWFEKRKKTYL